MDTRSLLGTSLATMLGLSVIGSGRAAERPEKGTCLVLADGYMSEYAWGKYQETGFPADHPGHDYCVRGLLGYKRRFEHWLAGWQVERIDLETHRGPLPLAGVDLAILDDVRQIVCESHETELVEFVRAGGGLLVYAGKWGLGGCPKDEYAVIPEVSSFRNTPLGRILPVEILAVPDWEPLGARPPESQRPVFRDPALGAGIDTAGWRIAALHASAPRGEVLAELDGRPLVGRSRLGRGTVVVYAGDDLGWVRQGLYADADAYINRFSATLWRRLAALAAGDQAPIEASADPPTTWRKGPAFAHPDQAMNFQWGGHFYFRSPEMLKLWAKDLVTHSATLYYGAPEMLGKAGIQGWESVGVPLYAGKSAQDPATWMVDAAGAAIANSPCYNNPAALEAMDAAVGVWAEGLTRDRPWVTYGHMGDETAWQSCYCDHCRRAFRAQFGYDLPPLANDFSQAYLDRWIDFQLFKNGCIGTMYGRAAKAAKAANPGLRMFASLPLSGGMCHGDDTLHTQSGFDLLWEHTYPGTMAIRVGLSAQLYEETAVLQGRPQVPIFNLLQGFDSYDRAPHVPPAAYMRNMTWQAIAHGIDSVGWFVYNAFFWSYPGTEAWDEVGRLGEEVLAPLTPTLYEMHNAPQPIGLLFSYSQEAVDGLKEQVLERDDPWKGVIRWWTTHATQEAYEVLKYAQLPFNVISEHRMLEGRELPWKAIVIPYAEHLHARTRAALQRFIAGGGTVYLGADSTLELPGARRLEVSFDTKFTTWWPRDDQAQWNQRRVRQYLIGPFLVKAAVLSRVFAEYREGSPVTVDDPEVVWSLRQAGAARYLFFINDHQLNPVSAEMRKLRQRYNHFMLMPMEFPVARTTARVRGSGYLYPLLSGGAPLELAEGAETAIDLELAGGDGRVFLWLAEEVSAVELVGQPRRLDAGVAIEARVRGRDGILEASIPLRIDLSCGAATQTVYATTVMGELAWTVPYLAELPDGAVAVTVTEMASGRIARGETVRP